MSDLFAHQQRFLALNPKKYLLAHEMGTGKTKSALLWALTKHPTLIICPKPLKQHWLRNATAEKLKVFEILTKEEFKKQHKTLATFKSVIVDESHYFSNYRSQCAKALNWYFKKHNTEYRLFLTATPYLSSPFNIFPSRLTRP